jgi:hypothetical protein
MATYRFTVILAGCHVAWVKIEPEDLVRSTPTGDVTAAKK